MWPFWPLGERLACNRNIGSRTKQRRIVWKILRSQQEEAFHFGTKKLPKLSQMDFDGVDDLAMVPNGSTVGDELYAKK